ncbi:MAG TPA: thiamine pyrophosphate-dependent dehydrogenase E1 component subunit alpha [Roseiflexaceae bacterium]|nr:thiamine pyrophosphate-dependent dehydrogenase E1 component subunit alpha [Roseiflexaceae bacterium]
MAIAWGAPTSTLAIPEELGTDTLHEMYRFMLLARALDERMWVLNRAGKASFAVPSQGHEAAQVGAAFALQRGKDFVLPYYRGLAMSLVIGLSPAEILMAALARAHDPSSGGRQMPNHFGSRRLKIVSQSSVVGTQIPHAAGIGLAEKIRGGDAVAWVSFGEGTTSQGDFHEGINLAAVQRLPVIFQCENNDYAISVPMSRQMAVASVAERAAAYGIPGISVDGTDVMAVYRATRDAVARARRGDGPTLIEAHTVRLLPHSSDDNDRTYRSADELAEAKTHDPITRFRCELTEAGLLDEESDRTLRAEIAREIEQATEEAEQAPSPSPNSLLRHVYAEPSHGPDGRSNNRRRYA